MSGFDVLPLGDPRLRARAQEVGDPRHSRHLAERERLAGALAEFRRTHGFGRAIAAPQLGIPRRFIALQLERGAFIVCDPVITWRSEERFILWDDCMCFPSILVRVRRHESISLEYTDEEGARVVWPHLERAEAELLQHEIDHLDGVLAVDRRDGSDAIVSRSVWARRKD